MIKSIRIHRMRYLLMLIPLYCLGLRANAQTSYCVPQHSYNSCGSNVFIAGVKLNTLDYTSGQSSCNANYPFRLSSETTTLIPGYSYTITLLAGGNNTQGYAAFIDYNQDKDFDDAGEYLGQGWTAVQNNPLIKTITIPCTAVGGKTRLRVRTELSLVPGANMSCINTNTGWGNTVDFEINIQAPASPTADFYFPASIYTNQPLKLVNSNNPAAFYTSHTWDFQANGTIEKRTIDFDTVFTTAGAYQFQLTSTNCIGSSSITKTVNVINPTAVPTADFIFDGRDTNRYNVGEAVNLKFFDVSTQGPTSWTWEITPDAITHSAPWQFINGTSYNSKNPEISFLDTGTYEVCLTATNGLGNSVKTCKPEFVKIVFGAASLSVNNLCAGGNMSGSSSAKQGILLDEGGINGNYTNNSFCTFLINPCGAKDITVEFSQFEVTQGDFLAIYDGEDNTGVPFHTGSGFSGATAPGRLVARSGKVYLEFVTDGANTNKGFRLNWNADVPTTLPPAADFEMDDTIYMCQNFVLAPIKNISTGIRNEYQWIFEYDPNFSYPTGYGDSYDEQPQYIYNIGNTYTIRLVVSNCFGSDTLYRDIVVEDPSITPVADFNSDKQVGLTGEVFRLKDLTKNGTCTWTWTISPGTVQYVNGTSRFSQNPEVVFLSRGAYDISLSTQNDYGTHVKSRPEYIEINDYCFPVVQTLSPDLGISAVKLGGINSETESGVTSYSDFSGSQITDLVLGGTYTLEISRPSAANLVTRKVWIDYNKDGIFEDPAERIAMDSNSLSLTFSTPIEIKDVDNSVLGYTKMRIATNSSTSYTSSCGLNAFGEFEDYGVNIIKDVMIPQITVLGLPSVTIQVNTSYTDDGATAVDNVEGNITSRIVTSNDVDTSQTGVYQVRYNVTDKSGNKAVQASRRVYVVKDNTAPVITLSGNNPYLQPVKTAFVDPGYTAIDEPGSVNITARVKTSGTLNTNVIGDYTLTYDVVDDYGIASQVTRLIQVRDTVRPVISAIGGDPYFVQVNSTFVDPTIANDNYDVAVLAVPNGSLNTSIFGNQQITYSAVDATGNVANNLVRTYVVGDTVKPLMITAPNTEVIIVDVKSKNFTEPVVTSRDDYYPNVVPVRTGTFDVDVLGDYQITYTATDGSGNTATFVRIIRVVDREKPSISGSMLVVKRFVPYDFRKDLTTDDNHDAPSVLIPRIVLVKTDVVYTIEGTYLETYQVTDLSGNTSSMYSRVVKVVEDPTSVGEDATLGNVTIYPNPTTGVIHIAASDISLENAVITLFDMVGKSIAVEKEVMADGTIRLQMDNAATGVYMLAVQVDGKVANHRVVVTR